MMSTNSEPSTRTIGVLGGMGPAAAADFARRIVDTTDANLDQEHLHVIVDNDPRVPDRTQALRGVGPSPVPCIAAMARRLEGAGAELLVMACNTAHAFYEEVAVAASVPLVDLIDAAARGVAAQVPGIRRVGLLATDGTLLSQVYERAFARQDVDVILPDAGAQVRLMETIYGAVKSGARDLGPARDTVLTLGQGLVDAGAQAILLACTELSVLAAQEPLCWPVPTFDAAQLGAEDVIRRAGGRVRGRET
jgi:aspartate racemase